VDARVLDTAEGEHAFLPHAGGRPGIRLGGARLVRGDEDIRALAFEEARGA